MYWHNILTIKASYGLIMQQYYKAPTKVQYWVASSNLSDTPSALDKYPHKVKEVEAGLALERLAQVRKL